MPHQDAQGRWISDDGFYYWDGNAWRAQRPVRRGVSLAQPILIGAGFVILIIFVAVIGLVVLFQNAEIQQSFCNGWNSGQRNSDSNLTCPFHPASP